MCVLCDGSTRRLMESETCDPWFTRHRFIPYTISFCGFPRYKPVPPGWFKICVLVLCQEHLKAQRKWFYGEAGNRTCDPWFTRLRFIPYTTAAPTLIHKNNNTTHQLNMLYHIFYIYRKIIFQLVQASYRDTTRIFLNLVDINTLILLHHITIIFFYIEVVIITHIKH